MSRLSDSIKSTSVNLGAINNSLGATKKSFSTANNSVNNINKTINNNIRIKRELFLKTQTISYRRREASRRRQKKDILLASNVSYSSSRANSIIPSVSSGSAFSRLLTAVGYITAGWLLQNIPTWTFMGKEFINRITSVGSSLFKLSKDVKDIFKNFNSLISNSYSAILQLDFKSFTEGSVARSFNELTYNLQSLGDKLSSAFSVFSVPLTESPSTGQTAPGFGEQRTDTTFPQLSNIHRQALDIIARPESGGSYNAMNQGTINDVIVGSTLDSKTQIKKNLTDMTIGEIMQRQAYLMDRNNPQVSDYGIYAAGKYQIIPDTMIMAVREAGLSSGDKFSPENQDKLGLAVLRVQGISAWTAGGSRYSASERAIIEQARNTPVTYTQPAPPTSQNPSTPQTPLSTNFRSVTGNSGPGQGMRPLSVPYSPFMPNQDVTLTSGYGYRYGRMHTGYDIAGAPGTPIYAYFPGRVTHANKTDLWGGGYGYWVAWKDSIYNSYHFFGHMLAPTPVNVGDTIAQGTLMGKIGSTGRSTGPHLHWEISNTPPDSMGNFTSTENPGEWLRNHPLKVTPQTSQQTTPAPSEAPPSLTNPPPAVTTPIPTQPPTLTTPPAQGGGDIIIAAPQPVQPPIAPQVSQSPLPPPSTISDFRMLNNFIKNKLLLDLAYL